MLAPAGKPLASAGRTGASLDRGSYGVRLSHFSMVELDVPIYGPDTVVCKGGMTYRTQKTGASSGEAIGHGH